MRIQVISDLHLEHGNPIPALAPEADVLVIAGDLAPATRLWLLGDAVDVPGNHAFYGSDIDEARQILADACAMHAVTLLDLAAVIIEGVRFIGATLWTNFKLCASAQKPAARRAAEAMDDFRSGDPFDHGTRHGTGQLTAEATARRHGEDRRFIEHELAVAHRNGLETGVVTHHAPTARSIPSWLRGHPLSAASASNLNRVIRRYQPTMWIHGHVSSPASEPIDKTSVVANPHGRTRTTNTRFAPDDVVGI